MAEMINTKLCVGSVGKRQQNKDFEVGIAIFAVSIFGIYPNQKEYPSDSLNQWGVVHLIQITQHRTMQEEKRKSVLVYSILNKIEIYEFV